MRQLENAQPYLIHHGITVVRVKHKPTPNLNISRSSHIQWSRLTTSNDDHTIEAENEQKEQTNYELNGVIWTNLPLYSEALHALVNITPHSNMFKFYYFHIKLQLLQDNIMSSRHAFTTLNQLIHEWLRFAELHVAAAMTAILTGESWQTIA